ncbi:hypothetical protein F4779DRAFT_580221 [Xylariaceae sp. FL0662B]|nr:hypothetical protein F4779DRAFT_580221 [Xylariaceae sp. FL0662B]
MANSLAALKSLPCPAGNNCDAFQCLFKHDKDNAAIEVQNTNQASTEENILSSPEQHLPRKRVKLDSDTSTTPQRSSGQIGPARSTTGDIQGSQTQENRQLLKEPTSSKKPVSQPVINRKPQLSVTKPDQEIKLSPGAQNSGTPSASSSSTKSLDAAKPASKATPKKPETLNPRLLKKSPAQHDTRLKLVKALHEQYARLNLELKKDADDEVKKLLLSDQELIVKTLDDEQELATKRSAIYANTIRNRIMMYKRMIVAQWKDERVQATKDSSADNTEQAPTIPEPIVTGLTIPQEIDYLHRLVWPFTGLERFGYVSSVPSDDDIKRAQEGVKASGNTEECDRCGRRFQVFPGRREEDGALASNGTCTYHPGKVYYMDRAPGDRSAPQKKYRCCHQNTEEASSGCATASTHVFKTSDPKRLAGLLNFAETPANPDIPKDRAVCIDCEMGYSVYGLELIRLTVVSWPNGEELLDVLVQPFGEYMDLNTRYSGVRPEDMVTAERWAPGDDPSPTVIPSSEPGRPSERKLKIVPSPKAARDLLFSLIAPKTPLIGHGLENDLNSLRVIHPTCIDTVILYPHKRGLPVRNGLRMLMETRLNRKIQVEGQEGKEGHDSAEDARAAGELVRLKVRDEWKAKRMEGWTLENDQLVPPEQGWTVVGGAKAKRPRA